MRRWHFFRRMFRMNRPPVGLAAGFAVAFLVVLWNRTAIAEWLWHVLEISGVQFAERLFDDLLSGDARHGSIFDGPEILTVIDGMDGAGEEEDWISEDPAYERLLAREWERMQLQMETEEQRDEEAGTDAAAEAGGTVQEFIAQKPAGSVVIREKLADFDYLMKNFYSVHPTTTAGRDMMSAEQFLNMNLSVEKNGEVPQILIYHTHSQETYIDYPENPEATIVGVGAYLTQLLEERGYRVIHDTSCYDMKGGTLERSQAYTYALDGINGILQKYPSIQVVLDLHRDGVDENTRLVTEVNGKDTAKLMLFNGISQTPDGPIEYLPNPNREANLAFSFQMQLLASEQYPDLMRKIYLKGLRYNQHVRARAALIEVGAQTNTYAEALNAMEPLADILCQVLDG